MRSILRKAIITLAAAAMLAAAAAVLVVSVAFAVFGLLSQWVGPPGAAALTALAAAALMASIAFGLEAWLHKPGKGRKAVADDQDLLQRLLGLAQERPIISVGALIGAVVLTIRNPALVAIVVKAFLDPKPRPKK